MPSVFVENRSTAHTAVGVAGSPTAAPRRQRAAPPPSLFGPSNTTTIVMPAAAVAKPLVVADGTAAGADGAVVGGSPAGRELFLPKIRSLNASSSTAFTSIAVSPTNAKKSSSAGIGTGMNQRLCGSAASGAAVTRTRSDGAVFCRRVASINSSSNLGSSPPTAHGHGQGQQQQSCTSSSPNSDKFPVTGISRQQRYARASSSSSRTLCNPTARGHGNHLLAPLSLASGAASTSTPNGRRMMMGGVGGDPESTQHSFAVISVATVDTCTPPSSAVRQIKGSDAFFEALSSNQNRSCGVGDEDKIQNANNVNRALSQLFSSASSFDHVPQQQQHPHNDEGVAADVTRPPRPLFVSQADSDAFSGEGNSRRDEEDDAPSVPNAMAMSNSADVVVPAVDDEPGVSGGALLTTQSANQQEEHAPTTVTPTIAAPATTAADAMVSPSSVVSFVNVLLGEEDSCNMHEFDVLAMGAGNGLGNGTLFYQRPFSVASTGGGSKNTLETDEEAEEDTSSSMLNSSGDGEGDGVDAGNQNYEADAVAGDGEIPPMSALSPLGEGTDRGTATAAVDLDSGSLIVVGAPPPNSADRRTLHRNRNGPAGGNHNNATTNCCFASSNSIDMMSSSTTSPSNNNKRNAPAARSPNQQRNSVHGRLNGVFAANSLPPPPASVGSSGLGKKVHNSHSHNHRDKGHHHHLTPNQSTSELDALAINNSSPHLLVLPRNALDYHVMRALGGGVGAQVTNTAAGANAIARGGNGLRVSMLRVGRPVALAGGGAMMGPSPSGTTHAAMLAGGAGGSTTSPFLGSVVGMSFTPQSCYSGLQIATVLATMAVQRKLLMNQQQQQQQNPNGGAAFVGSVYNHFGLSRQDDHAAILEALQKRRADGGGGPFNNTNELGGIDDTALLSLRHKGGGAAGAAGSDRRSPRKHANCGSSSAADDVEVISVGSRPTTIGNNNYYHPASGVDVIPINGSHHFAPTPTAAQSFSFIFNTQPLQQQSPSCAAAAGGATMTSNLKKSSSSARSGVSGASSALLKGFDMMSVASHQQHNGSGGGGGGPAAVLCPSPSQYSEFSIISPQPSVQGGGGGGQPSPAFRTNLQQHMALLSGEQQQTAVFVEATAIQKQQQQHLSVNAAAVVGVLAADSTAGAPHCSARGGNAMAFSPSCDFSEIDGKSSSVATSASFDVISLVGPQVSGSTPKPPAAAVKLGGAAAGAASPKSAPHMTSSSVVPLPSAPTPPMPAMACIATPPMPMPMPVVPTVVSHQYYAAKPSRRSTDDMLAGGGGGLGSPNTEVNGAASSSLPQHQQHHSQQHHHDGRRISSHGHHHHHTHSRHPMGTIRRGVGTATINASAAVATTAAVNPYHGKVVRRLPTGGATTAMSSVMGAQHHHAPSSSASSPRILSSTAAGLKSRATVGSFGGNPTTVITTTTTTMGIGSSSIASPVGGPSHLHHSINITTIPSTQSQRHRHSSRVIMALDADGFANLSSGSDDDDEDYDEEGEFVSDDETW